MQKAIDVSTIQRAVTWSKVKASGITAAMIKASQGRSEYTASLRNFEDSRFSENVRNAYAAGIKIGTYHYLTAGNIVESEEEAKVFLSVMEPLKSKITLWAAVDVESSFLPQDKAGLTAVVNAFCRTVKAGGYAPMVYTNPNFLAHRLNDISQFPLWLALWDSVLEQKTEPKSSAITKIVEKYSPALWQWGAYKVGAIPGIGASCDGDILIEAESKEKKLTVGAKVKLSSDTTYTNGAKVPLWVRALPLYVRYINADILYVSILKEGAITGVVNRRYVEKIL